MKTDRPRTGPTRPDPAPSRTRNLLVALAIVAAVVLAGLLHVVGVLPPG
jgi:hypothetical protein